MYITYKVYQMGRSAPKSLSSLSLGPERKCKCYNGYFVNGYVFHNEEYGQGRKTYNNSVCVKGSTSSELEVDYYCCYPIFDPCFDKFSEKFKNSEKH
jgi:hypothetical protein